MAAGFFEESNGDKSSTRLVMFWITFIVTFVWAVTCVLKHELVDIPSGPLYLVLMVVGGKAWQKLTDEGGIAGLLAPKANQV